MKNKAVAFILAVIMCFCSIGVSAAETGYFSTEEELAQDLKSLGLFRGVSDTEFELYRAPTRVEAVIMLIRLLGKDSQATGEMRYHPFNDVPDWADNYVGYAYETGLSNGTSETTFGTEDANAEMYLTFILRALGYSDKNGEDFVWDNPYPLAKRIGIIPEGTNIMNFWRSDVVLVSYAALNAPLKNSSHTLAQKLISEGVFTLSQFNKYYDAGKVNIVKGTSELTAEQVYEKCSPSVFYIEVYDEAGYATSSGSGFFIDSFGTAVTNYHVIDGASSAKITLSDSGTVYKVAGVYDYSEENDWAVISVEGNGFKALAIGDESTIIGGSTVYAIGSPLGLQNTISQGLISNANRELDGVTYIQTSAPISHGSSGGALINKYGEAIGITSAGFTDGENLNLAIPVSVVKGYDNSKITTLADMFSAPKPPAVSQKPTVSDPGGHMAREAEAYSWLAAVIKTYANDEYEGNSELSIEYETENGAVAMGLTLYEDYITADVYEIFGGTTYYCSIDIEPGKSPFLYYSFNTGDPYYYLDGEYFNPAIITANTPFRFSDGEGTATKNNHQNICGGYITDILEFINLVFDEYVSDYGYYSVADFGFVNFK